MIDRRFNIWIITLFPGYFEPYLEFGVAGAALKGERGVNFKLHLVNIATHSDKDWKGIDSAPYGGGAGMVMRADVLKNTIINGVVRPGNYGDNFREKLHVVYTSPRGRKWNNESCMEFAKKLWSSDSKKDLVLICGRYEGLDERFIKNYVDEEISVGDYVLTGGEIPVLCILDSALRFVPGVLGNKDSLSHESFGEGLLEHPQYTRPQVFEGEDVPGILLSGHHANIEKYRKEERIRITKENRADLFEKYLNGGLE